jgi:hypothetical protein
MSCCFKGSAKKEQPNIQTREYYRKKFNMKHNWRLNDREFLDLVQRFNKFATKEIMTFDNYRMMMGVLGNTFMTERMFQAMDKDKDNVIDLEEYLTYNDIISNGNIKEKREQNFAMLNDNRDSVVTYDEFEQFVFNILDMYSRTISEKINANKKMVRDIFDKIARRGKDSFTFEDYMEALDRDPNLFVWLEKPKEMLNELLNEQEGHYSKKFVDETIDLMFKYIATTEFAMKRILKYVGEVKGESLGNFLVYKFNLDDQDHIDADENLLLNINKGGNSRVGTFFSKKQGAYDEIERAHTKDHNTKTKFNNNSVKKYNSAAVNERSEDYEGGDSDSDSDSKFNSYSRESSNEEGKSSSDEKTGPPTNIGVSYLESSKTRSHLNLQGNKKADEKISFELVEETDDPVDNIESLCRSMLEVSNSLDIEMQKKISGEVNQGKVEINAKRHIRNQKIMDQTKNRKEPEKLYQVGKNNDDDDLPEDREYIDFGHESFDLVFNIMLGIKRSIDCMFESPFSKLRSYDYKAKFEYKNEWYSASETAAHVFIFYDYAPKIFEDIRTKDGISNDSYIDALGPNNIYNYIWTNDFKSFTSLVSSGKSGSLFYYSMDGRFMLKTIAKDEFNKLLDTIQQYHEHLLNYPGSLMIRYYGLHRIKYHEGGKLKEQYIIIMNNMYRKFSPDVKYDLKGSIQGRSTTYKDGKVDFKIAMKDNDFTEQNRNINMSVVDQKHLLEILQKDSNYLGENATLDYSLLLGIINLEHIKEEYQRDPSGFHESDPVLQLLKDGKSSIVERGIYVSENQKEVSTLFTN